MIDRENNNKIEEENRSTESDTETEVSDPEIEKANSLKDRDSNTKESATESHSIKEDRNLETKKAIMSEATVEEKISFITTCSSILRDNFDRNPLCLESFLDKVALIKELTSQKLVPTLIAFVKSKLQGKAREALPENITSLQQIVEALRSRIKPDSSKIVAGRITSLQVKDGDYQDFAKQAEDLADALERSLVIEGMTKEKAHEMAVEQTVSVCRINSKSDLVKTVLVATPFKDKKDVIAKMIVEQSTEMKKRQVLAFKSRQHFNPNSQEGRYSDSTRRNYSSFNYRNQRGNYRNHRGYYNPSRYSSQFNARSNTRYNSDQNTNRRLQGNCGNNDDRYVARNNRNTINVRALNCEAPQPNQMLGEETLD